jgi:hypothetical protein
VALQGDRNREDLVFGSFIGPGHIARTARCIHSKSNGQWRTVDHTNQLGIAGALCSAHSGCSPKGAARAKGAGRAAAQRMQPSSVRAVAGSAGRAASRQASGSKGAGSAARPFQQATPGRGRARGLLLEARSVVLAPKPVHGLQVQAPGHPRAGARARCASQSSGCAGPIERLPV